jgi:hypothetical protein
VFLKYFLKYFSAEISHFLNTVKNENHMCESFSRVVLARSTMSCRSENYGEDLPKFRMRNLGKALLHRYLRGFHISSFSCIRFVISTVGRSAVGINATPMRQ